MPTRRKQSPSQATPKRSPTKTKKRTPRAAKRPAAARLPAPHTVHSTPAWSDRFPMVGMGASAGGLEALEVFFTHMPADSGMAFVVLTHHPPQHVSLLPELLGRCTTMPVLQASEGMTIAPNRVYIAPSNRYLSVLQTTLHELDATQDESLQFPIDVFFRALAEDQQDRAVGIVLSGTGTDGTLGLKAIKEAAGITLVQNVQSAKYDGMPRSALATGLVDYVLPPADMPAQLIAAIQEPSLPRRALQSDPLSSEVLQEIFLLLRHHTGHDFSGYKTNTISRRLARRLHVHQMTDPRQYLQLLREQPHELDLIFKELLIGVSRFFRDPEAFDMLAHEALPALLAAKSAADDIRVWVPGCASGEEAYSLAILLYECQERVAKRHKVQLFATDLDTQAIAVARKGLYPEGIAADLRPDRLARFFAEDNHGYRITKAIRDMVIFASHDLISDPPFTKLDVLSCRNLLIYLDAALQKRLMSMFHYALRPHGLLFLGTSETIGGFDDLFITVDRHWKLYKRRETTSPPAFPEFPPTALEAHQRVDPHMSDIRGREAATSLAVLVEKLLLERYAPPSVIVNDRGEIMHIYGRTGTYLEPAPGQPRLNILTMARQGLQIPLTAAINRVATRKDEVVQEGVQIKTNGDTVRVKVVVQKLVAPETVRGLLRVSFEAMPDVAPPPRAAAPGRTRTPPPGRVAELERELHQTGEAWQKAVEESAVAHAEFKLTREEMQATNEELQSANEELETTREELQSLNEELQTVNTELQSKVDALTEVQDDMANLLDSIDVAAIFLDHDLRIKRFTTQATRVVSLIHTDIGRPMSDIASTLDYGSLMADAQEVIRTLTAKEMEVQTAQGVWYLMRIRPYRTVLNVINGLVLTFVDVTRLKRAELLAQETRAFAESIIQTVREPLLVLDADLRVVSANQAFYRVFHESPGNVEHQHLDELGNGQWNIAGLRARLEDIVSHHSEFQDFEVAHDFKHIGPKVMRLNARRLERASEMPELVLLAIEDVTAHRTRQNT
jgi:two-component system CheB/CheR fusion protein